MNCHDTAKSKPIAPQSVAVLTATEMIRRIAADETTIEEWAQDCVDTIKEKEPQVRAWEYFDAETVLQTARQMDCKRQNRKLGLLSGAPVGIKDVFNTKGMPTGMGSPIWADFTPGNDARAVFNIREEDGLIIGKTVTAEFAVHFLPHDKTVNPHNPLHTPGTSSSGSAAAVACGMIPLATGTQTAGSIIRPASYCGTYGYKPTFGVIPRTGILKTTDTLDTVGFFARSIEDIRLMFDATRVKGSNYPYVHESLDAAKPAKAKKIKVGIIIDGIWVFDHFEKYARECFLKMVEHLSKQPDVEIIHHKPSELFNKVHEVHSAIYDKTLAYYFKKEFEQKTLISEIIYEIIERGKEISGDQYQTALHEQVRIREELLAELKPYDLILTLSTAGQAPLLAEREKADTCLIWTLLGMPSLNVPLFWSPDGLPYGLQVVAGKYQDYQLLDLAERFFAHQVSI